MSQNIKYKSGHNKYIHETEKQLEAAKDMLKYVVYEFNYVRNSQTTTSKTYEVIKKIEVFLKQYGRK